MAAVSCQTRGRKEAENWKIKKMQKTDNGREKEGMKNKKDDGQWTQPMPQQMRGNR